MFVAPRAASLALVVPVLLAGDPGPRPGSGSGVPPAAVPAADHHIHIWSPTARDLLVRLQEQLGERVISEDAARPLTADDVIAGLDSAGIARGVVLSTAYFFGNPEASLEDPYPKVRAENDYVARQVASHPDRLVGFFSVNPLADYALREMERLADVPAFAGLKLHLANSGVDLRDPTHVARLREVFRRAGELELAVVVHLWTRREDFGARDVDVFVDQVLPAAPGVPVQVAHLGGGGGTNATRQAVDAFAAALEDHPRRTGNLVFDLSGVAAPEYMARGDSAVLEVVDRMNGTVLDAMEKLGPDRLLYGSDWPAVSMPRYLDGIRETLPLEREVFGDLVDDPAPYLR